MELSERKVCGKTYCIITPMALVPYYRLHDREIILLDSGCMLHGELERWVDGKGLHVQAILNTHAHWDHVAANEYFRRVHGARVYMPKAEAALYASDIGRKVDHQNGNFRQIQRFCADFPVAVDEEIGYEDGALTVCGAEFQVVHTPGHSVDHVAYITPDNVMYVGDALMSETLLRRAKLSFAVSHEVDLQSKEKLRQYACSAYILAHGSVEQELGPLIDANIAYVRRLADDIWRTVERPMSMEEIIRLTWERLGLHEGSYHKNLEMGNMIRALVQYLVSEGRLENRFYSGVDYYSRQKRQEE